ncbi:hypothetical protein CWR48_13445 [Oceanobacillus arenosus]|uniref:Thiamine pyrophosphate-binding protein n=1 Tax=Oceanobacillus arenosus TaxID=1229153 RepID=A0A3D8PRD1_9BACI|nr:thiamine pyrophosphate-binding protein [Oceanobacillus arenosus]RDW17525.1 hypothetical protein CWR48_13445 [Oceanobacillus arenosus]
MEKLTGGQLIVKWMEESDIKHFFNVPGESFLHIFDALYDSNEVQTLSFRHESGASFAAEAHAKITGKPIVCMATRGPGASNLSIGIQTAYYDGTPMIAMIGQVPRDRYKTGSFQEVAHEDFFKPISKEVFYVSSAAQLPAILKQAEWIAMEGKPGPVVISLPTDVLGEQTDVTEFPHLPSHVSTVSYANITEQIVEKISQSKSPIIISNMEAVRGEKAEILGKVAKKLGVPVITGWRRFSSFSNEHPNYIGSLGLGGPKVTSDTVGEADFILGFGNMLEDINVNGGNRLPEEADIFQICSYLEAGTTRFVGNNLLNYIPSNELEFLRSLLHYLEENNSIFDKEARMKRTTNLRNSYLSTMESTVKMDANRSRKDVHFKELNKWIPDDAIVASDAGNFAHWLLRYIPFDRNRVYLGPVNGAMGYAIPAGLGAATAGTDKPVWCIAGDGGAMMTIGELETIGRTQSDVVVVVINNSGYGTIQAHQDKLFPGRAIGTALGNVDFYQIAKSMNWNAWKVENEIEIENTLKEVVNSSGPRFIEIKVEHDPLSL